MPTEVNLYDTHYGQLAADPQAAVRRETYGEDLGRAGWLTLAEAREFFGAPELGPGQHALEVACGSGGIACRMALETGAWCVGVDINPHGVDAAARRARELDLSSRVSFRVADAGRRLPFPGQSFDAIFCNDSINHLPERLEVLRDWYRPSAAHRLGGAGGGGRLRESAAISRGRVHPRQRAALVALHVPCDQTLLTRWLRPSRPALRRRSRP